MKTSKTTKRALLFSVLALVLCASMLIGSTFAWFTDTVATTQNKIIAGNLDVELSASVNGGEYTEVTAETKLFKEGALWEPGHVEVVNLKIANVGTLALKYQFGINIVSDEQVYPNAEGGTFKLSDYIKFAVIPGKKAYDPSDDGRKAAVADAEANDPKKLSEIAVDDKAVLLPTDPAKEITLVVYMPTDVTNVANYRGTDIPTIDLGVKLVATQTPHEEDTFGPNYDKNLPYPVINAEEVKNALENGGNVVLGDDVAVKPEGTGNGLVPQMAVDKDTTLNLSGKELGVDASTLTDEDDYTPALIEVKNNATLTIDGDGVVNAEAGNYNSYGISVQNGTVIINDGKFYGALSAVQVTTGGKLVINGGFFDLAPTAKAAAPQYAKYIINVIDRYYKDGTATVEIKGGTFVNFDPSANPEGAGTSYVADGYTVVEEVQDNGEKWYTVVPVEPTVDETETEDPLA